MGELLIGAPFLQKLESIEGVLAEIDLVFDDVLEVLGDHGDLDVVLVVADDFENLGGDVLALDEVVDVGLVEGQFLLDFGVHDGDVVLLA